MKKDKSLKSKAVKIKNKDYVQVSDRVIYFNENYEKPSIATHILSEIDSEHIVVRAVVSYEAGKGERVEFTGHAQEVVGDGYINKTSALENAETSAVGRALAMVGIGVIESIASVDEVNKAQNRSQMIEDRKNMPLVEQIRSAIQPLKTDKKLPDYEKKVSESQNLTKDEKADLLNEIKNKRESINRRKTESIKSNEVFEKFMGEAINV